MCITSLSFATSVFAADSSNCATVLLDGIENNSLIDDTANAINECRTASGKTAIQLDNTLCEQAKQRAKDVFVYFDSDDKYLPNGDLVSSYLSNAVISAIYYFQELLITIQSKQQFSLMLHILSASMLTVSA